MITSILVSSLFLFYFSTTLAAQEYSIILGRPTDKSVTASIHSANDAEYFISYGTGKEVLDHTIPIRILKAEQSEDIEISQLQPNTRYYYTLSYKKTNSSSFTSSPLYTFITQRSRGSSFRFVIEADEHLYDKKGVRSLYKITLENQRKDSADFMISLGDTFGDDHTPYETTTDDMKELHKDYLQYLGLVCHSMPFYFCLGNHEGENGFYMKEKPKENIAVYGTLWRKYYYPNPYPNDFYSGNIQKEEFGIEQPENYYAWTWGDALFIVLDVYRHCDINEKPKNWDWTLGEEQYTWFKKTLEQSSSKYKFVFAHHTRGQGRGGVLTAKGYEWGGYEINKNIWEFDKYRPNWELPIHQLMVKHHVSVFFQGHDHLYAKEELDGIIYQEVPMACDSTYEIGVLANADAYTGIVLDGSGHLRVSVDSNDVTVDFVRAYLPADTLDSHHKNREIAYSYSLNKLTSTRNYSHNTSLVTTYWKHDNLVIECGEASPPLRSVEILSLQGETIKKIHYENSVYRYFLVTDMLPQGLYIVKTELENNYSKVQTIQILR
ncbi:MAG TPA: metallophosphoesterase [Candidatus Kapabacteria bacterium]|nr:metallophosphoesterase [Candidatus Kapabacteria bacterium]